MSTAATKLRLVRTIGAAEGPERFVVELRGLASGSEGELYAVGDREVKVFEPSGRLRCRWPLSRTGYCVAFDAGLLYIGQEGRVERLDAGGRSIGAWADAEHYGLITDVVLHGEDMLLGDATARCIRRCDRQGRWQADIGRAGNTRGFVLPSGRVEFTVDGDGAIHLAHSGKHRVERYALDGRLLGHWGQFGQQRPEDFTGCCNPVSVALGPKGCVVVTVKAPAAVRAYTAEGQLLGVSDLGTFHADAKNMDVVVDERGLVHVADTARRAILSFECDWPAAASRPASRPTQASEAGKP